MESEDSVNNLENIALYLDCDVSPSYSPRFSAAGIPLIRNLHVEYIETRQGSAAKASALSATRSSAEGDAKESAALPASAQTPLTLLISMEPDLIEPVEFHLPVLPEGETLLLPIPDIHWRGSESGYTEGTAVLSFRILVPGGQGYSFEKTVELIDPERYPGSELAPDLLLTFCEPDHPYVDQILDQAGRSLAESGTSRVLKGYDGDPLAEAEAIFQAIRRERLIYTLPQQDEYTGTRRKPSGLRQPRVPSQLLRPINAVARQHLANGIELAILYASALERSGLNPIIVAMKDECLVGAYLSDKHSGSFIHDRFEQLRLGAHDEPAQLFLIEASMLAGTGRQEEFREAVVNGRRCLLDSGRLSYALDVIRGRELGVRPWSSTAEHTHIFKWAELDTGSIQEGGSGTADLSVRHVLAENVNWLQIMARSGSGVFQAGRNGARSLNEEAAADLSPGTADIDYSGAFIVTSIRGWKRPLGDIRIYDTDSPKLSIALAALEDQDRGMGLRSLATALEPDELAGWIEQFNIEQKIRISRGEPLDLWFSAGALGWFPETDNAWMFNSSSLTPLLLVPAALSRTAEGYMLRYQISEAVLHPELRDILAELGAEPELFDELRETLPKAERELPAYRELISSLTAALRNTDSQARVMDVLLLHDMPISKHELLSGDKLSYPDISDSDTETGNQASNVTEPIDALRPVQDQDEQPSLHDRQHLPILLAPLDHRQLDAVRIIEKGESAVLDGPAASGKRRVLMQSLGMNLYNGHSAVLLSGRQADTIRLRRAIEQAGMAGVVLDLAHDHLSAGAILRQFEEIMDLPLTTPEADYQARLSRWQQARALIEDYLDWYSKPLVMDLKPSRIVELRPDEDPDAPLLLWPVSAAQEPAAAMDETETDESFHAVRDWTDSLQKVLEDLETLYVGSDSESLDSYGELSVGDLLAAHPWRVLKRRVQDTPTAPAVLIRRIRDSYLELNNVYKRLQEPLNLKEDPDGWYLDNVAQLAETVKDSGIVSKEWFRVDAPDKLRNMLDGYRSHLERLLELEQSLPESFLGLSGAEATGGTVLSSQDMRDAQDLARSWDEAELRPMLRRWSQQRKLKRMLRQYVKAQGRRPSEEENAWLKDTGTLLHRLSDLQKTRKTMMSLASEAEPYLNGHSSEAVEEALSSLGQWRELRTDLSALYPIPARVSGDKQESSRSNTSAYPDVLRDKETFDREMKPLLDTFREIYAALRAASQEWSIWADRTFRDPSESISLLIERAAELDRMSGYIPNWLSWLDQRERLDELGLADLDSRMQTAQAAHSRKLYASAQRACRDAQLQYALILSDLPWRDIDKLPDLQQLLDEEVLAAEELSLASARAMQAQVSQHLPGTLLKLSQARETDKLMSLLRERGRGRTAREVLQILAPMLGTLFPVVLIDVKNFARLWPEDAGVFDLALVAGADLLPAASMPQCFKAKQYVFSGDRAAPVLSWTDRPLDTRPRKRTADKEVSMLEYALEQGLLSVSLTHKYDGGEDRLLAYRNMAFDQGRLTSAPTAWHRKRNPVSIRRQRSLAGAARSNLQSMVLVMRQELQMMAEQFPGSRSAAIVSDNYELLELMNSSYAGLEITRASFDSYPESMCDHLILVIYDSSRSPLMQRRDGARLWTGWLSHTRYQAVVIDHDAASIQAALTIGAGGAFKNYVMPADRSSHSADADSTAEAWKHLLDYAGSGSRLQPMRISSGLWDRQPAPAVNVSADWLIQAVSAELADEHKVTINMGYSVDRIDIALPGDERLAILLPKGSYDEDMEHLTAFRSSLKESGWRTFVINPREWKRNKRQVLSHLDLVIEGTDT